MEKNVGYTNEHEMYRQRTWLGPCIGSLPAAMARGGSNGCTTSQWSMGSIEWMKGTLLDTFLHYLRLTLGIEPL